MHTGERDSAPISAPTSGVAADLATAALSLARRFAAGATMWCVAPEWPFHGRHVAVEFVHPVIVGKRALPARFVDGPDPVATVRLLARPGDIVFAAGRGADATLTDLLRRSGPWGLITVWCGAGTRPPGGVADHVVWLDGEDEQVAARRGALVLLYHLLWELTHVVFEHPGLLQPTDVCTSESDHCVTCSDEATVAEVAALRENGQADVVAAGARETVDVSLVDPVAPGDLVLVHAGVAISRLGDPS